ncbi:MAG: polyprenyl synthetase family protein [Ruminococcaceae bacterium]|nr:polyprenyl synthetase family protein [Oscillospiraceae bacterium]
MQTDFMKEYTQRIALLDDRIERYLDSVSDLEPCLRDGMKYSVLNGGKRLRSILVLEVCRMLGGTDEIALPFAMAVEFIHAYSLVHDDLPAMDNAPERRGKPSCHVKFGEGMAVLIGDALLNLAFEIMADACTSGDASKAKAMSHMAKSAGVTGMIGGQAIDLSIAGQTKVDEAILVRLIERKTMSLIRTAIMAGAHLAGASQKQLEMLEQYGYHLGLAFQLRDDIEDEEQDATDGQVCPNYLNTLGKEHTISALKMHSDKAREIISSFSRSDFLCRMHNFLFQGEQ